PDEGTVVEAMRDHRTVGHMLTSGELQLAVPLLAGGRSLGALELRLGAPLGEDDVKIVELLAAAAAVALQNAHLYQETQRLATTLTMSVGGTSLGADVVDRQLLISCADHALYEAKRNGRNQVRLWSDPVVPAPPERQSA